MIFNMNESSVEKPDVNAPETAKKPGFLGRLFQKLDDSMKQKAEEKSQSGCCCGGSDTEGEKCC